MIAHPNCVVLFVTALQRGFFISVGKLLRSNYRVVFVVSAEDVKAEILQRLPDAEIVLRQTSRSYDEAVSAEVVRLEEKYGETFSMLLSKDRALGHGYLYNVDRYPPTSRLKWTTPMKYSYLVEQIKFYERLVEEYKPVLVLALVIQDVQYLVFRKLKVPVLALGLIKYGTRLFWYDSPKYTSEYLKARLQECLAEGERLLDRETPRYAIEESAHAINSRLRFSYRRAVVAAIKLVVRDLLRLAGLRRRKVASYGFGAWLPREFRRVAMHRYFGRNGVSPDQLADRRVIFVPLHLEPEVALLSVSPEFNNSMEMVAWISKSAPADCVIVLKEHLTCLGNRSRQYYDRLRSLPNVQFARLDVTSWDWIKASSVVATVTGTAGTEAVYFDRPVLSFGAHQLINMLPTVRFADCYASTRQALTELLAIEPGSPEFHKAKVALHQTLMDGSFEFPGFEHSWSKTVIDEQGAATALRDLVAKVPGLSEILPDYAAG